MQHLPFPPDLVALKRRQIRIYNRLVTQPALGTAELRRELIRTFCRISSHPYWAEHGCGTAGRVELYRAAEARPEHAGTALGRSVGSTS
ncbi:hypothetical protein ACTVZO_41200 [Streptomyces sp. IBSNAI002]|uniref:hypothetical protein n=1 Tax=Streptomyces sp. IBSNAI002 TaxID=3457500 RepID=UPI003FD50664